MIGLLIALGLGYAGKWRWLGYVYLVDLVVYAGSGFVRGGDLELVFLAFAPVVEIALGYGIGLAVGRWRKGGWPRDAAIDRLVTIRHGTDAQGEELVYWQIETTALSGQVLRLFGAVLVFVFALMAVILGLLRPEALLTNLSIAAIVTGVLAALFAFVLLVLLFNRLRRAFVLTARGYVSAIVDPRLFAGSVASGVTGAAAGRVGQVGGALVSQRGETHDWTAIASAGYDPQRNRIHIRLKKLGWFGRDTIYCHPETYPIASAWVARHIAQAVD